MYCINCGTTNNGESGICAKCGHALGERQAPEQVTAVDIALAERASASAGHGPTRAGSPSSWPKIAVIAVLASVFIVMGLWRAASGRQQQIPTAGTASTTDTRIQALERMRNGLPVRSGKMENDMIHKNGARKIQMAVEQHFAEHGRYPVALTEISAGKTNVVIDESVYSYSAGSDGRSYTISVVMEATEVSGTNLVTEDGVYKYVLTSD